MSDPLADTTARLQPLVQQAMQETDPDKSDELYAEIWRVLRERDEVRKALRFASRGWLTKQIIALKCPAQSHDECNRDFATVQERRVTHW